MRRVCTRFSPKMNHNAESFYENRFQNTLGLSIDQEKILGKLSLGKTSHYKSLDAVSISLDLLSGDSVILKLMGGLYF